VTSVALGADAPAPPHADLRVVPPAEQGFDQLGVPADLCDALARLGISAPLPIQAVTVPDALSGRDVSAKAPTGSGKTLAFSVPLAARVSRAGARKPRGLVLAPTRELATQIADTLRPLLAPRKLRVHTFFGGVGFGGQRSALARGVDVAVACPGRLEDLMRQRAIDLSDVELVVVDEADRMADMGFLPAVRRILDATAPDRQTLLFSATLDGAVDVLVRSYQRDPARHEVATPEDDLTKVTHRFEPVALSDRTAVCAELAGEGGSTIVFVRTKHGADRLARQLTHSGVPAEPIHGGRSQGQRERTLASFRSGRVGVLVATDVAARGIHVDGVARVVHYDLPADAKDYVHRSGRTARAGATGTVIALVPPEQRAAAAALKRAVGLGGSEHPGDASAGAGTGQRRRQVPANQRRRQVPANQQRSSSGAGRNSAERSRFGERSTAAGAGGQGARRDGQQQAGSTQGGAGRSSQGGVGRAERAGQTERAGRAERTGRTERAGSTEWTAGGRTSGRPVRGKGHQHAGSSRRAAPSGGTRGR
jgi:superfamily II DNA/RNA helicase